MEVPSPVSATSGGAAVGALIFDPLQPRRDNSFRNLLVVSLILHLLLLFVFWEAIIGAVWEKDDTVTVKMEEIEPERPKRKVIAQRVIDTRVRQFKEIQQQQIEVIQPEVLDKMQRVEVAELENIESPKLIVERQLVAKRISAFAERPAAARPVEVPKAAPRVRSVSKVQPSAGPRRIEAAGPRVDPQAIDISAPLVREGVVSKQAVQGSVDGAKIRALESGVGEGLLQGDGGDGNRWGGNADCMKDPVCLEYLRMIRDRVYARWAIPPDTEAGRVVLAFRVDRGGSAHGVKLRRTDDAGLGASCEAAFRHASPFPPPPEEIRYIVNKGILATFTYGN